MPVRRWLLVILFLVGVWFIAVGFRGYTAAWSDQTGDPASVMAAGRTSMRSLPVAAVGILLVTAAGIGWWRDRTG